MKTTILFFGALAEITGKVKVEFQYFEDTEKLSEQLLREYPLLNNKTYSIAVNKVLIAKKQSLNEGDTIALLPPFAGG
jgi:molybdopterin synthase sulfur carrier subunit